MKKLITIVVLSWAGVLMGQVNHGEVIGKVFDSDGKSPAIGARIWVNTGTSILGAVADLDGRYRISAVPVGTYRVNIVYLGDTLVVTNQIVKPDAYCNVPAVTMQDKMLTTFEFHYNDPNVIRIDKGNESMIMLTAEDLKSNLNIQSPVDLIANSSSDIMKSDDGELHFRGARKGEMSYLLDGVKMRDISTIPGCSIGAVSIYTGGIPAKYGDTTGGVVVMETKSYFDLWRAWRATQL
jgi:hypothetical protein